MATLSLQAISKYYSPTVAAVKDVDLEVKDGEFIVLVGPSGCGKSTLLNMIAGLEDISDGQLAIGGRLVNDLPAKNRDIAMVFQNYALYPHMSVYENMAFGLKLRHVPKDEIDSRVQEAARVLSIGHLLERLPRELSGGQRQRVAVGRAIVRKPAIFLFDEPLSNLDAKLRVQMRVELKDLHQRLRSTMIYVTHDQTEAMTMGDRIVVMKDGIVQQVASPLELYDHPCNRFVASFIGSPPMNFFEGHLVKSDRGYSFYQENGISLPLPQRWFKAAEAQGQKKVILGLRPEGIGSLLASLDPGAPTLEAEVKVVEPMGSEYYLHVTTGQASYVARVEKFHKKVGDKMSLPILREKIYLFDAEQEHALPVDHRAQGKDEI